MDKKEKARLELTIKNILYYIEDETEQAKMIEILMRFESQLKDTKLKNIFDKWILSSKKNYYDKVDHLVDDILGGKIENDDKKIINNMLNEIKPAVEKAEKNLWEKLLRLFDWS